MKVDPVGHEDGHHPYTEHRTVSPELTVTSKAKATEDMAPEAVVEIGDKVIISLDGDAGRHLAITISGREDDIVNGIISIDSPAGKALSGASVEDEIDLLWKGETRHATVLQIRKRLAGKQAGIRQDGKVTEDSSESIRDTPDRIEATEAELS